MLVNVKITESNFSASVSVFSQLGTYSALKLGSVEDFQLFVG